MREQHLQCDMDVVIFGAGVAGLWLLARLRQQGYEAALIEPHAIGAGQTRYAQGIIHGGTKYALTGKLSAAAEMVAQMPARWRACLQGEGELDLRAVRLSSDHQYLWSTRSPGSRLAGFFASKLMRSRMQVVEPDAYPQLFRHPDFKGQVYALDEPVLDVASLLRALAEPHSDRILKSEVATIASSGSGCEVTLADGLTLRAKKAVLAAGKGNRELLEKLGRPAPAMQLRPLLMVAVRGSLPPIYAHCLGTSPTPRVTITSHPDRQGRIVWYLGGQLAEAGVGRSGAEQIEQARRELAGLFPWLDFSACDWMTLPIERAEPARSDQHLPDDVFASEEQNIITAWPTKLALAPVLADRIIGLLEKDRLEPAAAAICQEQLAARPHPDYAPLPWQEEERWN